tara:strand:+ start:562 stop:741 length:180 start_codon:yes stop_codon:yes gene_type:complete
MELQLITLLVEVAVAKQVKVETEEVISVDMDGVINQIHQVLLPLYQFTDLLTPVVVEEQ